MAKTQIDLATQVQGSLPTLSVSSSGAIAGDLSIGGSISFSDATEQSSAGAQWTHYSVSYSQFSSAGNTSSINLSTLNPAELIQGIVLKQSASFMGGSISDYIIAVGITGDLNKYAGYFDVYQAPASDVLEASQDFYIEDLSSPTTILITASSAGNTLNNASAGALDVWLLTSVLPAS